MRSSTNSQVALLIHYLLFSCLLDAKMNIEVKDDETIAVDLLIEALSKFKGIEERVIISSRWCSMLHYLRAKYPTFCTSACEREGAMLVIHSLLKTYQFWYSVIEKPQPAVLYFIIFFLHST
jgi:hypothetical protein